ncbi:MAG: hypothetical protein ACK4NS_06580, partial [Saprospiraceae bacterium]
MKKRNTFFWVMTLLACFVSFEAFSQANVNHPIAGNAGTFTIGAGGNTFYNYYDNGGPGGPYSNNIFDSGITFAPSNAATNRVRVVFSSFATEASFDFLSIYNSNTVGTNLIGSFTGTITPGPGGATGIIANQGIGAVGMNPSEALSFSFFSDFVINAAGWAAAVDQVGKISCTLTPPANATVSASANACPGDLNITAPTFNPGGCQTSLQIQYSVNGGAFQNVAQPLGATVTVSGLILGPNVILWRLVDPATGLVISSGTQNILVQDNIAPTITCPPNLVVNLSPGECCRFITWPDPVASDNCPLVAAGPAQLLQQNVSFTNFWTGYYINLTNLNATQAMNVTQVNVQASLAGFAAGNYNLRAYMKLGTHVGFENNAGAWTLVGQITANVTAGFPTQLLFNIPFTNAFQIPAGGVAGLYVVANNGNGTGVRVVAQLNLPPTQDANLRIQNPGVWANSTGLFTGTQFQNEQVSPQLRVSYNLQINQQPEQIAGPLPGSEICKEDSPVTVAYRITDAAGNSSTCSFNINLNPFPNPVTSLTCNNLVNLSLDASCQYTLKADQVLEGGPYRCYDDYVVEVNKVNNNNAGPFVPAIFGPSDVGKTYKVRVTDPVTGNMCWGNVKIEDKLPPVLDCPTASLPCNLPTTPCAGSQFFLPIAPVQLPASFVAHGGGTAFTLQGNNAPGGVYFSITNNTAQQRQINGFGIRFGNPQFGQVNPPQTMQIYTRAGALPAPG